MTKVEAKVAYEERCRRRRRQLISDQPVTQRRLDGQRYPRTTNDFRPDDYRSEAAAAPPFGESSAVATVSLSADVSMSPSAPEFVPAAPHEKEIF